MNIMILRSQLYTEMKYYTWHSASADDTTKINVDRGVREDNHRSSVHISKIYGMDHLRFPFRPSNIKFW